MLVHPKIKYLDFLKEPLLKLFLSFVINLLLSIFYPKVPKFKFNLQHCVFDFYNHFIKYYYIVPKGKCIFQLIPYLKNFQP